MTVKELKKELEKLEQEEKGNFLVTTLMEANIPPWHQRYGEIISINVRNDDELTNTIELVFD